MGERTGDKSKSQYRITESQMRLMTGAEFQGNDDSIALPAMKFQGRKVRASMGRVAAVCLGPLIPALLLVISAYGYNKSIPPGDMSTKYLAVGICSVMAGILFGGAAYLYMVYAQKAVDIEAQRIIVREGDALLTSGWSEVVTEPVKSGLGGVKTFVFYVVGRQKTLDSIFFPDFKEIVDIINERVETANRAMKDQTHVL